MRLIEEERLQAVPYTDRCRTCAEGARRMPGLRSAEEGLSMSRPSGVITITTDFGHQGPFVGVMKGRILSRMPAARIIDLTHEIVVHWPAEAGFWLARAFAYFPAGTVHVAVVDPGVGTSRDIIIVSAAEHFFVAPDNGLLAPLVARHPGAGIVRLRPEGLARIGVHHASATFHGRDIFAPVSAELAAGRCSPADLGETATADSVVPSWVDEPAVDRVERLRAHHHHRSFRQSHQQHRRGADRALPAAAGACRQPCFPAAADLW